MANLAVLPLTQSSFFPSKPVNRNTGSPSWPCRQRSSNSTRLNCQKMYVPGFGEASPETKASKNLQNFFNYIAVKIVCAQLQSYNPEAYKELMEFLSTHSLNDGNKFCVSLRRESSRHKSPAYCKHDFEWDTLKRLAFKMVDESNTKLMREYVLETSHETKKETGK